MVRQILCPMEADLVLSIPLSPRLPLDKMVWAGTSSGKFLVRSAYNSIMEATWSGTRVESLDGSTMSKCGRVYEVRKLQTKSETLLGKPVETS